ncbi:MAG TPA: hypothetical protein VM163_00545 [bacterium]|nr:hypothetical protein [bacterium]
MIFCYTPSRLFVGTDHRCTSEFGPSIVHEKPLIDPDVFNSLSFSRDFYAAKEALK